MSLYKSYLDEIETRQLQGLKPKPIDNGDLVAELIAQIRDTGHEHRAASLDFLIYNTLPGTTGAAGVKAKFLKDIILGETVEEISGYRHRIEVDSRIITVETKTPLADGERVELTRRTSYTLR